MNRRLSAKARNCNVQHSNSGPDGCGAQECQLADHLASIGTLVALVVNVIVVVVLTLAQGFIGQGLINTFIDEGGAQTMSGFGWWSACFFGSICFVLALDFFVAIAAVIGYVLFKVIPRMNSKPPADPPSTDQQG